MNLEHELYELLETAQSHLPKDMHKHYEEAVDRAMHQHSRDGYGWWHHDWEHEGGTGGGFSLFALVIAVVGGAALMYLFDPDRGAARRSMLMGEMQKVEHEAEDVAGRARGEARKLVNEAEDVAGRARGEASKLVNEAEDAAGRVRGEASKTASDVSKAASNAADSASKQVNRAADEVKKKVDEQTNNPSKPTSQT